MLKFLIQNAEKVLSPELIMNEVWGHDYEEKSNVLFPKINNLRKKITLDGETRLLFTSVRRGYVLKATE